MRRARPSGFTLIELMIAGALLSVVVLAISIVVTQQSKLFRNNENLRYVDENARIAQTTLIHSLRQAGFGMDPELAIDFSNYTCDLAASGIGKTTACTSATRESATSADELVTYHRNPDYQVATAAGGVPNGQSWLVAPAGTPASGTTIMLSAGTPTPLRKGQILLVACPSATIYTYVTLASSGMAGGPTPDVLNLDATKTDAFHHNDYIALYDCLRSSAATVFRIDRERFFIANYGNGHPYLMLDTGTDVDNSGTIDDKDLIPVAADIVDMQIAYAFAQDPGVTGQFARAAQPAIDSAGNNNWVLYDVASESAFTAPAVTSYGGSQVGCKDVVPPYYKSICMYERRRLDPIRYTNNPANIVAVQVGLVARTEIPDPDLRKTNINPQIPALFDRPAVAATSATSLNGSCTATANCSGFTYDTLHFSENTPNMGSRALFLW